MIVLMLMWILHWLTNKRSDYLISRGSLENRDHVKMFMLSIGLMFVTFLISLVFYKEFNKKVDSDEGETFPFQLHPFSRFAPQR